MTLLAYFVGHSAIQCPNCSRSYSYPLSQITNREELPLGELKARIIEFLKGEGWFPIAVRERGDQPFKEQLRCSECQFRPELEERGDEG